MPEWFTTWEETALLNWVDKNGDGRITYAPGQAIVGNPEINRANGKIIREKYGGSCLAKFPGFNGK